MLNIPELEKRWLHYKIKSFIPHVIIFISLAIIAILLLTFTTKQNTAESMLQDATLKTESKEPLVTVQAPVIPTQPKQATPMTSEPAQSLQTTTSLQEVNNKNVELKPSMSFMKEMQNSTQPYYYSESSKEKREISHPTVEAEDKSIKSVKSPKTTVIQEPAEESTKINIKRQNTQNDIQEIIKRFKKNQNPALSLFVAKKYYELGDYHQSYNYALITNQINRNIEASWIIFSQSLVKLGKKDMAVKTLNEYIKSSHSESAKLLMNEITSGKFK